jgi:glycerol kinase
VAFPCQYPHPGWVEQDALAIWDAQMEAARRVLVRTGIHPREIAAAGIANQRETTVVWDRATSKPIAPAIVWQCRRTADFCAALRGLGVTVGTGIFQAMMSVELVNEGPVTILLDSDKTF